MASLARLDEAVRKADGALISRNVIVNGRRTSMRLEPALWDALHDIGRRERASIHSLCSLVDARRGGGSLTAAMRVFIVT